MTVNVETATGTYEQLAKRGEKVVKRIRKETSSVVDPGPVKEDHRRHGHQEGSGQEAPARKVTAKKAPAKKTTASK